MSKRSDRREADRQARKEAYRLSREPQSQFAAPPPALDSTTAAAAAPALATAEPAPSIAPFNSTTHGCCASEILVLANESRADFDTLERAWLQSFCPTDKAGEELIQQLIAADWLNRRSTRTYAQVEAQIFSEEPNPLKWTEAHHRAITRFQRYRTANQNAFKRALKVVQDYFKNQATQADKAERLALAKARQKVHQLKHAPEPNWQDLMIRQQVEENNRKLRQIKLEMKENREAQAQLTKS